MPAPPLLLADLWPPDLAATDLVLAGTVLVIASALQGAVGFGANLVAAPLLVLIEPAFVPGPLILVGLALNALMIWRERHPVPARTVGLALAGRIPGSVLGAWALASISGAGLDVFFGALVLVAVLLAVGGLHVRPTPVTITGAGVLSGFMGTSVSIGGPPIALLYQHEDGPRFRAVVSRLLIYGAFISLALIAAVGRLGRFELVAGVAFVPPVLAGFALSARLATHLDQGHTRTAVLVTSACSALLVVIKAVL